MTTRILYRPVSVTRIASLAIFGSALLGCAAREAPPAKSGEAVVGEGPASAAGHRLASPSPTGEAAPPEEQLSAATIQGVMRESYDQFRTCYEGGLLRDPKLAGRVTVRFAIDKSGRVESAELVENPSGEAPTTDLPDRQVLDCLLDAYRQLEFPAISSGMTTVVYPIAFSPEEPPASDAPGKD